LRPIGSTSDALWFGTLVHIALAEWYIPGTVRGIHPAETFQKLSDGELRHIKTSYKSGDGALSTTVEKLEDAGKLGVTMMEEYVKHWGLEEWKDVIQAEQTFQIDVEDPRSVERKVLAIYTGTYDDVHRDLRDDTIWLDEHKTAKAISTSHLDLDDQGGSYWATAAAILREKGLIGRGERLRGIMYNFMLKRMPDERPVNAEGYSCNKPVKDDYIDAINKAAGDEFFSINPKLSLAALETEAEKLGITVYGQPSKNQPKPLFVREAVMRSPKERASQVARIANELIHMEAVRTGALPLTKNPTRDCSWDCSFHDMCVLHEQGREWTEYRDRLFKQEDPYADHRASTEE
jgi:hypothetical protein